MSGSGSGGGGSAPSNTTSQNTTTYIQDVPQWEQQYLSSLLGQAQTVAAQPYQQFPGQQVAGFTPEQTQAFSNVSNLVNNGPWSGLNAAANDQAMAGANTANTISSSGSPYLQAAANYNPLAAASPFIGAAASSATPQGISQYLSPYTNDVVHGLVNTANQNWNQNIMPGVNDAFVGHGQFASGRNAEVLGQAANNFQTNLNTSVSDALQSGYNMAGQQAATQAGILGNLANTAGSTAQAQASNLANVGTGLGNLAATQSGAQGAAAANLSNTGQASLNTGITAAAALQGVGQQQQNLAQQNLDVAKQDFQTQAMWPQTQTSFLSDIIRGLPAMGGSGTSATQTPTTNNMIGSVSPLSSLAGSLVGAGAAGVGAKRGGLIHGYASGGEVDGVGIPENIDIQSLLEGLRNIGQSSDNSSSEMSPSAPTASASHPDDGIEIPFPPPSTSIPPVGDEAPISAALNDWSGNDVANHDEAPISAALTEKASTSNPSSLPTTSSSPSQLRNYQLLAMAKGFLTPAHSGSEALGNAIGNYAEVGLKGPHYEGEQQDVVSKQISNATTYAGLARQNMINQSLGFPTIPLPNVPGLEGYGQQIQQSIQQPSSSTQSAVTTQGGQLRAVGSDQTSQGTASSSNGTSSSSAPMNIMRALQIANGRVPASEDQKYQAVVTLQGAQFPVPAAMAEEAKQYAQDSGKLGNAKALASETALGQLPSELAKIGATGTQTRDTATLEASMRPHDIVLSDGTTIHTNDLSAAQKDIKGLRQFNPQQQDLMKEDVAQLHEMQPNYEAAQNGLAISAEIRELGNIADKNPWTRGGPMEPTTQASLDRANDLVRRLGGKPVSDKELASAVGVNKLQTQLTSQATKLLGSREAAQIYQYQLKAQPGMAMAPQARNLMLNIMDQSFGRISDRYNLLHKSIASPDAYSLNENGGYKTGLGAINDYDKAHPGTEYSRKALEQSGMSTPKFSSPSDPAFLKLPSGSHFMDDRGVERVKH